MDGKTLRDHRLRPALAEADDRRTARVPRRPAVASSLTKRTARRARWVTTPCRPTPWNLRPMRPWAELAWGAALRAAAKEQTEGVGEEATKAAKATRWNQDNKSEQKKPSARNNISFEFSRLTLRRHRQAAHRDAGTRCAGTRFFSVTYGAGGSTRERRCLPFSRSSAGHAAAPHLSASVRRNRASPRRSIC